MGSGVTEEIMTVQQVATYLKVTTKTVYALAHNGELRCFRIGRAIRFRRAEIEQFVDARMLGRQLPAMRAS